MRRLSGGIGGRSGGVSEAISFSNCSRVSELTHPGGDAAAPVSGLQAPCSLRTAAVIGTAVVLGSIAAGLCALAPDAEGAEGCWGEP